MKNIQTIGNRIQRVQLLSWCHQCKIKHDKIVVCDHFWDTDKSTKCNGRYCANCCNRHYGKKLSDLEKLESWICFKCTSICVCAACRRLRNSEREKEVILNKPTKESNNKRKRSQKNNNKKLRDDISSEDHDENYSSKIRTKNECNKNIKREHNQGDKVIECINEEGHYDNKWIDTHENKEEEQKALNFDLDILIEASCYQKNHEEIDPSDHNNNTKHSSSNPELDQNLLVSELKEDIKFLNSEIGKMKEDFANLQNLFQSIFCKGN
eukprot:TRINITY_DN3607_c0_g2_i2.p1 TRINITY_DN3607_c0_g2~~TRINITY_DN3607_c0_g2_i2.p1  ORF type:complete len:267 (-),score=58.87 TRINITY_DN3607_c0_g2_i2:5-805(-)